MSKKTMRNASRFLTAFAATNAAILVVAGAISTYIAPLERIRDIIGYHVLTLILSGGGSHHLLRIGAGMMADPFNGTTDPLMSYDGDWWAFPKTMTRIQVCDDMLRSWTDHWLCDYGYYDDDDEYRGWAAGVRAMWEAIRPSRIRPARYDENGFEDGWWYEDEDGSVEAWVIQI